VKLDPAWKTKVAPGTRLGIFVSKPLKACFCPRLTIVLLLSRTHRDDYVLLSELDTGNITIGTDVYQAAYFVLSMLTERDLTVQDVLERAQQALTSDEGKHLVKIMQGCLVPDGLSRTTAAHVCQVRA
jgi:hypothetical protein